MLAPAWAYPGFIGKIGNDDFGQYFKKNGLKQGIDNILESHDNTPSAHAIVGYSHQPVGTPPCQNSTPKEIGNKEIGGENNDKKEDDKELPP